LKLKQDLTLTVLLQAGGGAATLLAAVYIGRQLGPAQQGQFNQLKSLVDLCAAVAALGLPQALYVHAQAGRLALSTARRIARRVALLGLPLGAAMVWWHFGGDAWLLMAALGAAAALATLQQLWRALALLGPATWRFNLVTVAPQVLLLPVAALVVFLGGASGTVVALALAGLWLLSCVAAGWAMRLTPAPAPAPAPAVSAQTVAAGDLLRHGAATWITASAAMLGIVLLQTVAQRLELDAGLGRFSMALLLMQLPLAPLSYAVPLLLRHRLTRQGQARLSRSLPWLCLPILMSAGLAATLGAWRSDLFLGPGYAGLHTVLAWLLVAGAAEAGMRLLNVDAHAEGRPGRNAWAEVFRVSLLALWVLVAATAPAGATLVNLAQTWALASWAALVLLMALARQQRPQ